MYVMRIYVCKHGNFICEGVYYYISRSRCRGYLYDHILKSSFCPPPIKVPLNLASFGYVKRCEMFYVSFRVIIIFCFSGPGWSARENNESNHGRKGTYSTCKYD